MIRFGALSASANAPRAMLSRYGLKRGVSATSAGRSYGAIRTKPFRPWHRLRHTALTETAAAGVPAMFVQAKAGTCAGIDNGALPPRCEDRVP
jgi:hypothetical protein